MWVGEIRERENGSGIHKRSHLMVVCDPKFGK
jgi:hypothetical protein